MVDKITDYLKLQNIKTFIMSQLDKEGMVIPDELEDDDLDKVLLLLSNMGDRLQGIDGHEKRIDFLLVYVASLWIKLITEYGVELDEL